MRPRPEEARPRELSELPVELVRAWLDALPEGGVLRVVVRGRSMWPALRAGDVLHVRKPSPPRRGDVLLVAPHGRLVAHRFLRRAHGAFVLKGDGNLRPDRPMAPEAIVGQVVAVERRGIVRSLGGRRARLEARAAALLGLASERVVPALDRVRSLLPRRR